MKTVYSFISFLILSYPVSWTDSDLKISPIQSYPTQNVTLSSGKTILSTTAEFIAKMRQAGLFDETVMLPMRDGIRLSTTIFKPLYGSPWPAVLVRTPYGKSQVEVAQLLVLSNYAIVIQDMRGRFDSEGTDRVFIDDGWGANQDGYDTIEWIAKQTWSTGKVGMWGPSALGIAQSLTAGAVPPHLTCQVIGFAPSEGYGQAVYQSGVLRRELIENWLKKQDNSAMLSEFISHPYYDDFWALFDIESRYPLIKTPGYFIGGFYDCFSQGSLNDFVGRQYHGAPGAAGNQKLMMGPWTHVNEGDTKQGQLTYPTDSAIVATTELNNTLRWFDYWLKGKDNGIMKEPPVTYYVMGDVVTPKAPGNEWRKADTWPPAAKETVFYLHPQGKLYRRLPASGNTISLTMQPNNPTPTLGGANLEIDAGPFDQSPLLTRADVIAFTTENLPVPVEVIGRVKAVIYASSNLTDNDLTVRLTDVYPDGRSMLVCDGIARISFRDSWTTPSPIVPETVYRYEIDLWSTSIVFNQGHQIRILIANTNSPRFDPNAIYQQLGQNGLPSTAMTILQFSPEYPSQITLPVTSQLPEETGIQGWELF